MPVEKKPQDLLDMMDEPQVPPTKPKVNGGDLLDLEGEAEKPYSTSTVEHHESPPSNVYSTQLNQNKEDVNFFGDQPAAENISIPLV